MSDELRLVEAHEPDDPLDAIEASLRHDLDQVRTTLKQRRQDKTDLFAELKVLVAAEETLVSALRAFDRRAHG
jgi:hypothetical protein